MAIISHQDADKYLSESTADYYIFLLFGADPGLIVERRQKLVRSAIGVDGDSLQIVELSSDVVAADPSILVDEANAINMFGGTRRVIRISAGSRSLLPALELVARTPPANSAIIVEDGELKRDSPLRKWVETKSFAVSIECRSDGPKDVQRLIDAELNIAKLSIDPDARDALAAMLGEDRLSTRSELDKLTLYARGERAITIEHINNVLHDVSALSVDAAISAVFAGHSAQAVVLINKALQTGVDINLLVTTTMRYALALHRCRAEIDNGAPFEPSLQILLRQVYGYNRKAEIAHQLRHISLNKTKQIINALSDAIKATRQSNTLGEQRIIRLLLSFTALIRRST